MMMISKRQDPAISELARDMGADRTTMTRNLEQLQKRGFIEITQGKNFRTKAVRVSRHGQAALQRSIAYWQKAQSKVLKTLGQDRWTRMLTDLSALASLTGQSPRSRPRTEARP
jgi:DNA-binding MarR family transcriptional regulator